jgi:phosphatidylserine decarboxylase
MITPYGRDNALILLLTGAAIMCVALLPVGTIAAVAAIVLGLALICFTLWFFRDSERPLHSEAGNDAAVIVSPADGQVTEVFQIEHNADIGGPAIQITIFLSPINLHVNRYPASGTILRADYHAGKYLMAFNPKASEENERAEFVVDTGFGRVLYRQITGFLARRIVYDTTAGDVVRVGERFGMMKFGSRMDVVVPADADVCVRTGQKVVSSATMLARLHCA